MRVLVAIKLATTVDQESFQDMDSVALARMISEHASGMDDRAHKALCLPERLWIKSAEAIFEKDVAASKELALSHVNLTTMRIHMCMDMR